MLEGIAIEGLVLADGLRRALHPLVVEAALAVAQIHGLLEGVGWTHAHAAHALRAAHVLLAFPALAGAHGVGVFQLRHAQFIRALQQGRALGVELFVSRAGRARQGLHVRAVPGALLGLVLALHLTDARSRLLREVQQAGQRAAGDAHVQRGILGTILLLGGILLRGEINLGLQGLPGLIAVVLRRRRFRRHIVIEA